MNTYIKIGMVCYPSVGGSGILATELGHQLATRGHQVHFITYEVPFRLDLNLPNIHFHPLTIPQYDLFKYPDYALTLAVRIANVARRHHLDLIHVHYAIPHATSAYLAKQLCPSLSIITTLHGTDITLIGNDPSYLEIVKFSINQSTKVTAVSHSLKEQTEETFSPSKEIFVIPNFFVPRPVTPRKLCDEKLIIHSSNFREVKRPDDVLAIFRKVQQELPVKLALIGPAPKEWASDEIILLGSQREIDPLIAAADLFLLPSEQESFGLAALEAMAYGVPVVASNTGGLPELIEHGVSGMLAPIGDTDTMARYAIEILRNRDPFSQAAKTRAQTLFSAEKIVPQYEAIYV